MGPSCKYRGKGVARGIQLNNLPTGALCWITQPNGKKLFLAPVSGGIISGQAPKLQPLPSFMVSPPPGFTHLVHAFGRIWGARGKKIYYSDPLPVRVVPASQFPAVSGGHRLNRPGYYRALRQFFDKHLVLERH